MNGQVNERDPDIPSWKNEVEASLGGLQPEDRLSLDEARFRKILKKNKSWSATGPDGIVIGGKCFLRWDMHCIW